MRRGEREKREEVKKGEGVKNRKNRKRGDETVRESV